MGVASSPVQFLNKSLKIWNKKWDILTHPAHPNNIGESYSSAVEQGTLLPPRPIQSNGISVTKGALQRFFPPIPSWKFERTGGNWELLFRQKSWTLLQDLVTRIPATVIKTSDCQYVLAIAFLTAIPTANRVRRTCHLNKMSWFYNTVLSRFDIPNSARFCHYSPGKFLFVCLNSPQNKSGLLQ